MTHAALFTGDPGLDPAALFGNLTLLILDPLALFTRTMTTAILPAVDYAVTATETVLYPVRPLRPALDWMEGQIRGPVLPATQGVFVQNVLIAALFAGILALNAFADRFWCRYLCPLGALLGLASKVAVLRPVIGVACNRCARCLKTCRLDAIGIHQGYTIMADECIVCLDCMATCPKKEIGFRPHWRPIPWHEYNPSRRQALAVLAASVAGVILLRTSVQARKPHPRLLRPPGAQNEHGLLARCLRCGQCMRACPTSGLQPTLVEAGPEGLCTPRLVPRLGYCDYGCNACGQICPSGAIPYLTLADKRKATVGLAAIDRNRCLPWAYGVPCIVCEEMCPLPEKAVQLEQMAVIDDQGESTVVQRPHVRHDRCIGCGICEYRCPVAGEAAIKVYRR
jgi:MauM/NapG family ferredoxin protein